MFADVPIWSGPQLAGNWDVIRYYTVQHLRYTIIAVTIGTAVALPLAYLAVRRPSTYPALLVATNVIYAIPSIALFVVLGPWLGFTNDKPIVTAMVLYSLVILVRNIVEAVRSVPPERRRRTGWATGRCAGSSPSSCRSPCRGSSPGCAWRP